VLHFLSHLFFLFFFLDQSNCLGDFH
jgi:hypothetical protein